MVHHVGTTTRCIYTGLAIILWSPVRVRCCARAQYTCITAHGMLAKCVTVCVLTMRYQCLTTGMQLSSGQQQYSQLLLWRIAATAGHLAGFGLVAAVGN
jgi:hypothetical protein